MNLSDLRLEVVPGDGLVAHFGHGALLVVGEPSVSQDFVDELINTMQSIPETVGRDAGRWVVRRVAGLITQAVADPPAFGLVVDLRESVVVLLQGGVTMALDAPGGDREVISGADSATWIDRVLNGDFDRLELRTGEGTAALAGWHSDLRSGMVPGIGLVLSPRTAGDLFRPASSPLVNVAVAAEQSAAATQDLPGPSPAEVRQPTEPPDSLAGVSGSLPVGEEFVSVRVAGFDATDRTALPAVAQSRGVAETTSSPISRKLVLSDGTEIPVVGRLLLGREPQGSGEGDDATVTRVVIDDPGRSVSRIHASVSIADGILTVEDLGSSNGTRLAQNGDAGWTALRPHEPAVLSPGGRLQLGSQELRYVEETPAPAETPAETGEPPASAPIEAVEQEPLPTDAGARERGIGDYAFVRQLGVGGPGTYFLAKPPERLGLDAEFVVVKVTSGKTSDDAFRRATRQLRAFAAANSPYLVKVHDAGQDGGRMFYSMEYVSGGSLAEPAQPLDDDAKIRAVAQAARAAHALHEVGVAHQGIKPQNILLGEEHAYLADLGLVQLIGSEQITSLGNIGGVEFLDPSILRGGQASRASDLWSLGATLHRVLTGVGIYEETSSEPLLAIRAALTREPRLSDQLAPELAETIDACLTQDPARRLESAMELAERLEALLPEPLETPTDEA